MSLQIVFNFSSRLQDSLDKKFENQKKSPLIQIKYLSECMFIMLPLNTVLMLHCCPEDWERKMLKRRKDAKQLLYIRFRINNCPTVIIRKISNFSYLCTS